MSAETRGVSKHRVDESHAGRRLDNLLLNLLKGAPRSLIYKLVRSGQVRINGRRAKPSQRLSAGDEIRLPPHAMNTSESGVIRPQLLEQIRQTIIYEDHNYLVVNKLAGLACHGGSGIRFGLIEAMRQLRPDIERLDLGHRLDRDTSGCVLLSKHLDALRSFHAALRSAATIKRYSALCHGSLDNAPGLIDAPLEIQRSASSEKRSAVDSSGKPAQTAIEAVEVIGHYSFAELRLLTGRMHQIRAHLAHLGHAIAGDRLYASKSQNQLLRRTGLKRMFLHAHELSFQIGDETMVFNAPLPSELDEFLTVIRSGPGD